MSKKVPVAEKRKNFIMHLLDKGWQPNVEYIDKSLRKIDGSELEVLLLGKLGEHFHLITPCGSYTVRVKSQYAAFWQKDPKWVKLVNARIGDYELTDKGVKLGILKLEID